MYLNCPKERSASNKKRNHLNIFRLSNEHPSDCWQPRLGVVRRKTGIWKERLKSSTSTSHSAHWKKLRLGSNENQNKQFYRKIIPSPEFWVQLGSILNEKIKKKVKMIIPCQALKMKIKNENENKKNINDHSISSTARRGSKSWGQLGFASAHCRSSASSHLFPESPSINSLELFDGFKVNSFIFFL